MNRELGLLPADKADAIVRAADEVIEGKLDDHFPLVVWQTGSGTQTNMNANEVIANRAIELLGGVRGLEEAGPSQRRREPVAVLQRRVPHRDARRRGGGDRGPPASRAWRRCATRSTRRRAAFADIVKIGRTHLQDATPLTLGQEISGWVAMLDHALAAMRGTLAGALRARHRRHRGRHRAQRARGLRRAGGEDAGRAHRAGRSSARPTSSRRSPPTRPTLAGLTARSRTLAAALMKIANDVRWLASGPRSGLGEISHPGERAGLSIMPGKVNPDPVRGAHHGVRPGRWATTSRWASGGRRATSS